MQVTKISNLNHLRPDHDFGPVLRQSEPKSPEEISYILSHRHSPTLR